ncbi:mannose-6-phosphate isomerase [Pelomyxa schiedti]|nr:mannose-6-phosphate isomerase [Pelomyxa schiedti]
MSSTTTCGSVEVYELRGAVKAYDWGTRGAASIVALLSRPTASTSSNSAHCAAAEEVEEARRPYAELWVGSHPSGRATACAGPFDVPMPFLLKVLSVAKPLSIQAHPDKVLAAKLHTLNPRAYPDDNHKPEMAIALTEFFLLCGFRPVQQLLDMTRMFPEFASGISESGMSALNNATTSNDTSKSSEAIRIAFMTVAHAAPQVISNLVTHLNERLHSVPQRNILEELVYSLTVDHPGDVGVLCSLFLNHLTLQPGQAVFIGPNIPHAYLSGECIECMACSDNVVRAGLTNKFVDIDVLCNMFDYIPKTEWVLSASSSSNNEVVYQPPPSFPEFRVTTIRVPPGNTHTTQIVNHTVILIYNKEPGILGTIALEYESDTTATGSPVHSIRTCVTPSIQNKWSVSSGSAMYFSVEDESNNLPHTTIPPVLRITNDNNNNSGHTLECVLVQPNNSSPTTLTATLPHSKL